MTHNLAPLPAFDRLARWSSVQLTPVSPDHNRHSIHSYFNVSPEGPGGAEVLYYSADRADAGIGDLRILDRRTNEERILIEGIVVEDAHRVAAQQWVAGGRYIVWQHEHPEAGWGVYGMQPHERRPRLLASGRLLGMGRPDHDEIPIYGPHWAPGNHRDVQLLHVPSGAVRTIIPIESVLDRFPDWVHAEFGTDHISGFFPVLSPHGDRIIFKIAAVSSGNERSEDASHREGIICADVATGQITTRFDSWGHPAWHPDNQTLIQVHNLLLDTTNGTARSINSVPDFGSGHPSPHPDGKSIVTDTQMARFGGPRNDWGIALVDVTEERFLWIAQFDNSDGAKSWRQPHPHPVFNKAGNRIYVNINAGGATRLHTIEPTRH